MSTAPAAAATPATTATATTPAAPAAPASTSGAMTAATTAAAPAPAVTTETVNPGSWMAGFNDELKGYVSLKGFKDPATMADAYRNLEKLQGVPQDRLLKLPEAMYDDKGVLTAEGRGIAERLGAPKTSAEYGIEMPKEGGDPKRLEHFLKNAHELGLTKAQAQKLAAADGEYLGQLTTSMREAQAAAFRDQDASLTKDWGAAKEANTRIAQEAVRRLGWDAAKIDAVAGAIGHAETMKLLCNLGKATGEGSFIQGGKTTAPMEPATAQARISELKGDKDFGSRLMAGEAEAKALWQRLHAEAFPGMVNL